MVFGDNPLFDNSATTFFNAPLFTSEMAMSPITGLIQLFRTLSQSLIVPLEIGLRLRVRRPLSQITDCSLKVQHTFFGCPTNLSKYSTVSAPLSAMISRPRRLRSDAESTPAPEIGQILARLWL